MLLAVAFRSKIVQHWQRLCFFLNTVRYLHPVQFVYRFLFEIKFLVYRHMHQLCRKVYAVGTDDFLCLNRIEILAGIKKPMPENGFVDDLEITQRAQKNIDRTFDFLNVEHQFVGEMKWQDPSVSRLWGFHLHYFDYVRNLAMAYWLKPEPKYYETFKAIVADWIDQNKVGQLDGWHPYTISLRVVNWIYAWVLFQPELDKDREFAERFLHSLYQQCLFLSGHLEYQSGGNHLLANAKALLFAGTLFNTARAKKWSQTGGRIFRRELDKQILGDGGHYERSPGYHWVVMNDVSECCQVLKSSNPDFSAYLSEKLCLMVIYAQGVLTPENKYPLLNDASEDQVLDPMVSLSMAKAIACGDAVERLDVFAHLLLGTYTLTSQNDETIGSVGLHKSGYFILRTAQRSMMAIDCGAVCPDDLPAHAHADTLGYEFWFEGVGFVRDSGVYEYTSGKWRDFFRSTRAHNTVVVDGENQSEVWGSFRVARRAKPQNVVWLSGDGADYFAGSHDGYARLPNPVWHRRRILRLGVHIWLVLDCIEGVGNHLVESFVHFHPEVVLEAKVDRWFLTREGKTLTLYPFGFAQKETFVGDVKYPQGWYAPEFGVKHPRSTMCLSNVTNLPFEMGYVLVGGHVNRVDVSYELGRLGREGFKVVCDGVQHQVMVDLSQSTMVVQ